MTDTRWEMTRAQFAEASVNAHDRHWLTGEESFLHVPVVMQAEGWNIHGHDGHDRLTKPQRVLIGRLALKSTRWRPWARRGEGASLERFSNTMLSTWYNQAVARGEITPDDEPAPDIEAAPTAAAAAFDDWFCRAETREASRTIVGDDVRRHRDDLCRLID